jgi:hypothetical protein
LGTFSHDDDGEIPEELEHRYLSIPHLGSRDGYQDMVDFIETITDEKLRDLLRDSYRIRILLANSKIDRSSGWADDRVKVRMKVGCHSNNNSQILREDRLPSVGYANG